MDADNERSAILSEIPIESPIEPQSRNVNTYRPIYQPVTYSSTSSFFATPEISSYIHIQYDKFVKSYRYTKPWHPPAPLDIDPLRSFESTSSFIVQSKISENQRMNDEKTKQSNHYNKFLVEITIREIRPGAIGWKDSGHIHLDREIKNASTTLSNVLNYIQENAIHGNEIMSKVIVDLLHNEIDSVHKYHMNCDRLVSNHAQSSLTEMTSSAANSQSLSPMTIFYNELQQRCPMLLYIFSWIIMSKNFVDRNLPSFVKKRLFDLCSRRTIENVAHEIDMKSNQLKSTELLDSNDESDCIDQTQSNEQIRLIDTNHGTGDEPIMKKRRGGKSPKPKSMWDRWPNELTNTFSRITYLIGIMFNMKANGSTRSVLSNLALLLQQNDTIAKSSHSE